MLAALGVIVFIGMVIDENFFEPKRNHKKYVEFKKEQERITGVKWDGK